MILLLVLLLQEATTGGKGCGMNYEEYDDYASRLAPERNRDDPSPRILDTIVSHKLYRYIYHNRFLANAVC